jgi:Ca2+-binding RTX toxin-like protein
VPYTRNGGYVVSQRRLGRFKRFNRSILSGFVFGTVLLLGMFFLATPAFAAATCISNGAGTTVTLDLGTTGDSATIFVAAAAEIHASGTGLVDTQCGTATTATATAINVTGSSGGGHTLTINQNGAGGAFLPANDFTIDLGSGSGDGLVITGNSGVDTITFGATNISMNGGSGAATVTISSNSVESFTVNAGNGNDIISGAGGGSTGTVFTHPLTLNGEANADTLTGGSGNDTLNPGTGTDNDTVNC